MSERGVKPLNDRWCQGRAEDRVDVVLDVSLVAALDPLAAARLVRTPDRRRARPARARNGTMLARPDGPVFLDCKLNAAVAAPFMSEFHEFETRKH